MPHTPTHRPFASLATLLLLAGACGDDAPPAEPDIIAPPVDLHTPEPDAVPTEDSGPTEPEVHVPGPNRLEYLGGQLNAAGAPCVDSCFLRETAGNRLTFAVRYVDGDGLPLEERLVRFALGDAPSGFATLSALSGYTDADGIARVELRSHGLAGSLELTASVTAGELSLTRTFTVTFDPPPHPDLAVAFEYRGRGPLTDFTLRAWRTTDGRPFCAEVHPDVHGAPAPDLIEGPFRVGSQARVETLPGLLEEGTQTWTVQLVGPVEGDAYASGCVEGVVATRGATAEATIYVLDLPLNFRGDYRVTTSVDALSGGSSTPIGRALITLTELFTRPGGLIVRWACAAADGGTLGTLCNFLVNSSGDLTLSGGVIAAFADSALLGLLASAIGEDNQQAAQIIAEILRELRFIATMTLADEPSTPMQGFDGARFAPGDAREEWEAVRFRWKFDPTCKQAADPTECGWTTIPMEEIYGHRPTAGLSAGIDRDLALHVDLHRVPTLTFGPLINGIVERRLLSLLFASGSTTPIASWEDLVGVLLGDRECLYYNDCCDIFAERIEDSVPGWVAAIAPFACDAAIPLVGQVIRNQFTNLSGALNLGTRAEAPCQSVDFHADRWVDAWGEQGSRCGWNMYFETQSGPYFMTNSWWGHAR